MREYYDLLRATSRTFAVGIEALPRPLRDAVTLAYLVLRVSDYFEDSPTLSDERKEELLERWAGLVLPATGRDRPSGDEARAIAEAAAPDDANLPDHLAARRADLVLEGLASLPPELQRPIREHTAATTRGMARWVARGPDFPDEEALDDYMFEVAGRVGLLLTDLFAEYSPAIRGRKAELKARAVSFGLGLQTVNVVRGLHEDPKRGWSFVPRSVLDGALAGAPHRAGEPSSTFFDPRRLPRRQRARILEFLTAKASRHVQDALAYCRLLPRRERGIRLFCVIPALLAARTIQVSARNQEVFERSVKVVRPKVRRLVLRARLLWFSNTWLTREEKALEELREGG